MADGKLIIETELGTKSFEAQYKQLESELKAKQKRLNELLKVKASGGDINKASLNADIVKTQASVERLSNKMLDLKLKTKDTGDEAENTGKKFDFNFKKMGNTVKRFALSLIGLRTTYALVSRASSAYLSQDTELAEKLKSVWVGLGSFLAPVLEFISNSLLKALGYLNVFIKALTGIDFLARANAKALKAQASAQKELNNQTYDFDVIRKQQDTSSSGGVGGSDTGSLFDIPELDEKIVSKLQKMAEWLKENWDWIKKVGEALLLVFGASAISKILKNIGKLLGLEGLGGLSTVLSTLATIGIIAIGVDIMYKALTGRDLVQDLKDIKKGLEELAVQQLNNVKTTAEHAEQIVDLTNRMKDANEQQKLEGDLLETTTQWLENETEAIYNQAQGLSEQILQTKYTREEQRLLKGQMEKVIDAYEYLYNNQKLNENKTYDFIKAIDTQIRIMGTLGEDTTDLRNKYKELTGREWDITLNTFDNATYKIDNLYYKLSNLTNKAWNLAIDAVGNAMNESGLRHYAVGGIVSQPTRALIGEAGYPEAVVPMTADYLSTLASEISRYGGGSSGSQPINIYFDGRLIQRQTASRENQLNFITNT